MKNKTSGSSSDNIYKLKVPWFEIIDPFLSCLHKVPPISKTLTTMKNQFPMPAVTIILKIKFTGRKPLNRNIPQKLIQTNNALLKGIQLRSVG
jgi:hypothetical protein